MKFVIARFCFVTKVTHLLHANNTHETKVYRRIFTLLCFNKLKKTKKKTKKKQKKTKQKQKQKSKQISNN